ncbi:MAG: hypothetical protein Q4G59_07575, partial [Planctomycetia bacterium]|nr:hypothetical protein [Planctomycetia bacterium]
MQKSRRQFLGDCAILSGIGAMLGTNTLLAEAALNSDNGVFKVGAAAIAASPEEFPVAVDGYFNVRMFDSVVEPLFA